MEVIIGIILILSFIGMVWYCVKGLNLMIGFFLMAALWTALALIGNAIHPNPAIHNLADPTWAGVLYHVFAAGPANYASQILVNIFFGAFFGRVLIDTGIASTLIHRVVKLGGERPRLTVSLICVIVTVMFMTMTGIGPVISIAVIVLPIFASLGIDRPVGLFAFVGAIMAGILANPINFAQYQGIYAAVDPYVMDYDFHTYSRFAYLGSAIALAVILVFVNLAIGKNKFHDLLASHPHSINNTNDAPWYSWIAILLPLLGVLLPTLTRDRVSNIPMILGFILAAIYAMATTGYLRGGYAAICRRVGTYFADGAVDVAPMVGFLLMLSMFANSAAFAAPYFSAIIGHAIPTTPLVIAVVFAIVLPLGFFRGPTNLVGSGAAILPVVLTAISASLGRYPGVGFMFPMFAILTIVPQHLDITQSWVAWGLSHTKVSTKDFMRHTILSGWLIGAILIFLAYFLYARHF